MEHTKNYNLPQWAKEDRIMMEDFNQAMSDIDAGIDDARSEAKKAQASAAELPYVVGTYVGTGEHNRHFTLGFRPRFLLVGAQFERVSGGSGLDFYAGFTCGGILPEQLKITADGFTVNCSINASFPNLNYKDYTYDYIAFR